MVRTEDLLPDGERSDREGRGTGLVLLAAVELSKVTQSDSYLVVDGTIGFFPDLQRTCQKGFHLIGYGRTPMLEQHAKIVQRSRYQGMFGAQSLLSKCQRTS